MIQKAFLQESLGVVATEQLNEGTVVVLDAHSKQDVFGSPFGLPGVRKITSTSELNSKTIYLIEYPPTPPNQDLPIYVGAPQFDWALRLGFDKPKNTPFNAEVHLTPPSVTEAPVIPSGAYALAVRGILTLTEDHVVVSGAPNPGDAFTVDVTTGYLKYPAGADPVVAELIAVEDDASRPGKKLYTIRLK